MKTFAWSVAFCVFQATLADARLCPDFSGIYRYDPSQFPAQPGAPIPATPMVPVMSFEQIDCSKLIIDMGGTIKTIITDGKMHLSMSNDGTTTVYVANFSEKNSLVVQGTDEVIARLPGDPQDGKLTRNFWVETYSAYQNGGIIETISDPNGENAKTVVFSNE